MEFLKALEEYDKWRNIKIKRRTLTGYDSDLRHFCIFMRNRPIEDIKIGDALDYLNLNIAMGFSSSTMEKRVIALREFFQFFGRQGYEVIDYRLIPYPRKEYAIPRVATEEDYRKLVRTIPNNDRTYWDKRNKAIIGLLYATGARIGELMSLNVQDIKGMRAEIRTEKTRGIKPFRQIFWKEEANYYLIKWLDKREEMKQEMEFLDQDALFVGIKGGCVAKKGIVKRLDIGAAGEILRKLSNKAGLDHIVNAHSFRHHLGRELARKGANNSIISNILGHSSLASSFQYTQLEGKELEEQYKKYRCA